MATGSKLGNVSFCLRWKRRLERDVSGLANAFTGIETLLWPGIHIFLCNNFLFFWLLDLVFIGIFVSMPISLEY